MAQVTHPNKIKGNMFERQVLLELHRQQFIADRTLNAGIPDDRGDIHLILPNDRKLVIQCKNVKQQALGTWIDEAAQQTDRVRRSQLNDDLPLIPVVIHKRRGTLPARAFVTIELAALGDLLL
jgi:hypothetical protein